MPVADCFLVVQLFAREAPAAAVVCCAVLLAYCLLLNGAVAAAMPMFTATVVHFCRMKPTVLSEVR